MDPVCVNEPDCFKGTVQVQDGNLNIFKLPFMKLNIGYKFNEL